LTAVYGSDRVLPQDTAAYNNFTGSFWSEQQAQVQPHCVFKPAVDTDVSVAVLLSRLTRCPFAAKSGGHAAFRGSSNIPGGVTIWFKDLNEVKLNEDHSIASVGPGNIWGPVYKALEPYGLTVLGGRSSDIGVGGMTTGGGISYYSNLYGWVLDNVESFEVVTARGAIVKASQTEHPDLYWGLRGGGNNLGLVTKFNLYTIPSPKMRGGERVFSEPNFPAVTRAFIDVVNRAKQDGNAQYYIAYLRTKGVNIASAELTYAKDVAQPEILKPFRDVPAISDSVSSKTLLQQSNEINAVNPNGLREVYWPIAVRLNEEFANWAIEHWFSVLGEVSDVQGGNPVLIYQALTEPILASMNKHGGNALGLDSMQGPLHLLHISFWWEKESDDAQVYKFTTDFWNTVIAKAKQMGIYNGYVYMNYASKFQDPIASYGKENKARLQRIAAEYDPTGVYQTLQPGYFKLNGAPADNPYN
jgi:FAD/FMN-containing dehydrogenase